MKNCSEYQVLLSAYLDGELASGKQEEIRRHLEECASCQEAFQRLQEVVNWTSALPMVSPPEDLKERILSQTVYRQGGWYPWKGVVWDRRVWIPAVGTAVLLGLFGWYSLQGVKQPVAHLGKGSPPPKIQREKGHPPRESLASPLVPSKVLVPEIGKRLQRERTEQVAELTPDQPVQQVARKRLVLSKEEGKDIRFVLKEARKRKASLYGYEQKDYLGKGVGPTPKSGKGTQDQDGQPKEPLPVAVDETKGSTPSSLPPTPEPAGEPSEVRKVGDGMLASIADRPPEVVSSSTNSPMPPLWPVLTSEEQSQEVLRRLQKRWGASEERILKVDVLRIQF